MLKLVCFQDVDGVGYSVHSKQDSYHDGISVVKITGFPTINEDYINSITAAMKPWNIKAPEAGVPDDADHRKLPTPLDAIDMWDVLRRLG